MLTLSTAAGNIFFDNSVGVNMLSFETSTTLNILKSISILNPRIANNAFGIYSFVDTGRDGTARFGRFKKSEFNLRKRDATCTWNPQGGLTFGIDTVTTCAVQYEDEMCPGSLWDTCWEKLLGVGMDKHDFWATEEGAKFMEMVVNETFLKIGNDYQRLVEFAGHAGIIRADDEDYWIAAGTSPEVWDALKKQQITTGCKGYMSLAEEIKTLKGYDHFNVVIDEADVDGKKFNGDAIELFRSLVEKQTPEMAAWNMDGGSQFPQLVIKVTTGIFNRYKEQLTQMYTAIPQGYMLMIEGEKGQFKMRNVLEWDGYIVVAAPEWDSMFAYTGITPHIAMMTAPGVIGITGDVPASKQFDGMGLVVTQRLGAPFKGKTYFENTFRAGSAILDHNYVVYASLFLDPVTV